MARLQQIGLECTNRLACFPVYVAVASYAPVAAAEKQCEDDQATQRAEKIRVEVRQFPLQAPPLHAEYFVVRRPGALALSHLKLAARVNVAHPPMHTASGAIDGGGVIVLMLDVVWGGIVVLAAVPTLANALTGHLEAAAVRLLGFNFWAAVTPCAAWTSAALAPVWVFVPIASLARPEKAREALLEPNSVAIVVAVFFLDHLPFFSLKRPLAALVHLHLLAAPTGTVRSP